MLQLLETNLSPGDADIPAISISINIDNPWKYHYCIRTRSPLSPAPSHNNTVMIMMSIDVEASVFSYIHMT